LQRLNKLKIPGPDKNATRIKGPEVKPKSITFSGEIGQRCREYDGFLFDAAYATDTVNQVECILSAVIYCSRAGIFNDDHFEMTVPDCHS